MSTTLAHDEHGPADAPVVVLGSSLGTTRSLWDTQLPELSRRFRVVRYDHRGHGDSPAPPGPYRLEELAADVLALLDCLGVATAHLGGVSLGGMVAMHIAGTAPERVDRLALVCTSSAMAPGPWRERAAAVRAGGVASVADTVASRWFTDGFASSSAAQQQRDVLHGVPDEGYAACCEAIATMDLPPLLVGVRASTLVVVGADDPATPPDHGAAIVAAIAAGGASARLEVVPGAHLANVESADLVTGLLLRHFSNDREDDDGRRTAP